MVDGWEPDRLQPSDKAPNIGLAECKQPAARKPRGFREALLDAVRRPAELLPRTQECGKQCLGIETEASERTQVHADDQSVGRDRIQKKFDRAGSKIRELTHEPLASVSLVNHGVLAARCRLVNELVEVF